VGWVGIPVHFYSLGEAHALACQDAVDILLRQGFDVTRLLSDVGGLLICICRREGEDADGENESLLLHS
jgi:hypothetical protein